MLTSSCKTSTKTSQTIDSQVIELAICIGFLLIIVLLGISLFNESGNVDFANKGSCPSSTFLFGTDWLGRDIFKRTISGLTISLFCALISTFLSTIIAIIMAFLQSSSNRLVANISNTICDLICGIPQIVLLLIISIALNRGVAGVILGISLTHWASLSRILRGEIKTIKRSAWYIFAENNYTKIKKFKLVIPELIPQIIVGATLFFPHAIMHESTLTFLGFGLPSETPAIGIILSEASTHLAQGMWWVAIFPGIALILTTLLIKRVADITKSLYGIN